MCAVPDTAANILVQNIMESIPATAPTISPNTLWGCAHGNRLDPKKAHLNPINGMKLHRK